MGTSRYRRRCGNTATNPNCFADSCVKRHSMWADNANTYTDRDLDGNTDCDTYRYTNCNIYTERNTNTYPNIYRHADSLAYSYAKSDTKTSADSASSAVRKWWLATSN
jgi:hypothetical protein